MGRDIAVEVTGSQFDVPQITVATEFTSVVPALLRYKNANKPRVVQKRWNHRDKPEWRYDGNIKIRQPA